VVAHELGHVLLHGEESVEVLGRTRLLSSRRIERRAASSPVPLEQRLEREANVFATALLMPDKAVRNRFIEVFGVDRLLIGSERLPASSQRARRTMMEAAKDLAGKQGKDSERSMADFFGVSIEAMATRLCELRLVQ